MTETGHNSIASEQLRSYVERIVSLELERRQRAEDIREVLKEAEGTGYESHAIKKLVKAKMMDEKQRDKAKRRADVAEAYASALQMELAL